ncbi:serine hydrolase domain-containing protein [Psychroserpens sp. BH13MA-6]
MKKILLISILLIPIMSNGQEPIQIIDSLFNSKLSEDDPALFVGVLKDGEFIYEGYKGLANLQNNVKASTESRSNIASVAKQFTALMILDLALKGRISLEDDIRTYVPKLYPDVKERIRIRHLLNHTSGIRDYSDLMSIQQKPWWKQVGMDNDDVMELLEKQQDLAFEPGSKHMYSNSGYTILTKIIAKVTGEDFYSYSKNFFKNLGMENTSFSKSYMEVIPNVVLPYSDWGDGVWKEYPMLTNLYGDGFLYTTLKDQLHFEQAIQKAPVSHNRLLIESQKPIPNSEINTYGFGLELEDRLNYKAVHHSGSTGSYHSQIVRFPEQNLSVFVMSSNSRLWSGFIADEIAQVFLPKKESEIVYDESIKSFQEQASIESIVGQYRSPDEIIIRIQLKEGKIYWQMDNNQPIELSREKDNLYAIASNTSTKIGFKVNKDIDDSLTVFCPNSKTRTYQKIADFNPKIEHLEAFEGDYYSEELETSFSIQLNGANKLRFKMKGWKNEKEVEPLTKNDLLVSDYRLHVERDVFDRVTAILLTTNRVLNNKFIKKTKLFFQPKIETENGSIQVTTIGSKNGDASSILLTKNYPTGNEIWSKQFGGKSYDKASSILEIEDGYLIIGSTSSYGNGNYDVFVIKTDKQGNKIWQHTYGDFYNEYGYSAEKTKAGYIIKGTIQKCSSNSDVFNRTCTTNVWFITIDAKGNEISNKILEKVDS